MRVANRFLLWSLAALLVSWMQRSWMVAKLNEEVLSTAFPLLVDSIFLFWFVTHALQIRFLRLLGSVLLFGCISVSAWLGSGEILLLASLLCTGLLEMLYTSWLPVKERQRVAWYQGARERMPGLKACVHLPDGPLPVAVESIHKKGALLVARPELLEALNYSPIIVQFFFRNRSMMCTGSAMVHKHERRGQYPLGVSVRFIHNHADARKSLGDFLELLKGAGHGQPT